jgi:hypothetical protein
VSDGPEQPPQDDEDRDEASRDEADRDEADPSASDAVEPEWVRRRRLARIFGNVLPETTRDERDERGARAQSSDDWLKSQVPPHHGG